MINGQPEIFTGSPGFANVRAGDRLEVRGTGRGRGTVVATYITLLGRGVPADQTGAGTTRSPSAISTPSPAATTRSPRVGTIEGTVQQVNAAEGRIVIVTDRRQVMTIRTPGGTPVYYRNETYRVANLEVGDQIRIEADSAGSSTGEIRARSIEVTRNVQEGSGTTMRATSLTGHVSRVGRTADLVTIDTGRQSIGMRVVHCCRETPETSPVSRSRRRITCHEKWNATALNLRRSDACGPIADVSPRAGR